MGVVYISGRSDDVIEVEGDVSAEFLALEFGEQLGGYLAFSDGTIVKIMYDGVWKITPVVNAQDSEYLKEYEAIEGEPDAYSDVVRLSNSYGFKWAVLGKDYSATRRGLGQFESPQT